MFDNSIENAINASSIIIKMLYCPTIFPRGVKHRIFKIFFRTAKITKHVKYFIDNFFRSCTRSIYLINDNKWLDMLLKSLSEDKFSLCHWSFSSTNNQTNSIYHSHNPLNFSTKILMSRCVNNIDIVLIVLDACTFGTT